MEDICKTKGCSYYTLSKDDEFKKMLDVEFDYIVFAKSLDIYLRLNKGKSINVYGSNDTDIRT